MGRNPGTEKESGQKPDRNVKKDSDFKAGRATLHPAAGQTQVPIAQARSGTGINQDRVHHLPRKASPSIHVGLPGYGEHIREQLHSSYLASPVDWRADQRDGARWSMRVSPRSRFCPLLGPSWTGW